MLQKPFTKNTMMMKRKQKKKQNKQINAGKLNEFKFTFQYVVEIKSETFRNVVELKSLP